MDVKTAIAIRALDAELMGQIEADPAFVVSVERAHDALVREVPLIGIAGPVIDPHRFGEVLREYRRLLAGLHPALAASLGQAERAAVEAGPALIHALVDGDAGSVFDLATARDAAPQQVWFLGQLALRPFMVRYAWSLSSVIDLATHRSARCPICGSNAHMGHIDTDNVMHLHCPLCETEWRGPRVGCVYCGAHGDYFTVDGDEEHRVDICNECGGYLKVLDQRVRVRPVDWFVEDAATLALGELAEAEGFQVSASRVPRLV